jgi:outer membrane protein OmpA-like peptidoglycan-associated protein
MSFKSLSGGGDSNWLSIADMMTALMIIFMFIALNYILQYAEYQMIENEIYNKLAKEFEDSEEYQTELGPNGAVRFTANSTNQKLFREGKAKLTPFFKDELDRFLPEYWKVLSSEPEYFKQIQEIRIEGHADSTRFYNSTNEQNYLLNLGLSQRRAKRVLAYVRQQPLYDTASAEMQNRMDFLFTATGFSFSRTINSEGKYTFINPSSTVDKSRSRRVEFRVVTSNEELINKTAEKKK